MINEKDKLKLNKIAKNYGGQIYFDEPMAKYSAIQIGGNAEVLYSPGSIDELVEVRSFCEDSGINVFLLGNGSNVLLPDEGFDGVIISLSGDDFKRIEFSENYVLAGAGVTLPELISEGVKRGLSGHEGLVGIPATVGGALIMNAGYKETISDHLTRVLVLYPDGEVVWRDKEELTFGYRSASFNSDDIILEAVFHLGSEDASCLKDKMREYYMEKLEKQPLDKKSLGCAFKNPTETKLSAGKMIEKVGLKGFSSGDVQFSEKHANFIVNIGEATAGDVKNLLKEAQDRVSEEFSVKLIPEVQILGARGLEEL